MVVDKLVHIEGGEDIERVAEVYFPWDSCIMAKDREKVCTTDDRVDVDDGHYSIAIAIDIWLNDPHVVVGIRVIEGFGKKMNKCAGVYLHSKLERKEQVDPANVHAPHPWYLRTIVQNNTIASGRDDVACLPAGCGPNCFAVQAASPRRITRRTECGGRRVENGDLLCVCSGGAESEWRSPIECWILFIEEKVPDKVIKVYLTDVLSERLE